MPDLFGLPIARLLRQGIRSAGGLKDGTLIRVTPGTRTPGDLGGGTNPTETSHSFEGFYERRASTVGESRVRVVGEFVSLLGDSLPSGIEPQPGDRILIEDFDLKVAELVDRDPAAALYRVRVEGS